MLCLNYWDVFTTWNLWSSIIPDYSFNRRYFPIAKRNWILIARCLALAGPVDEGGLRRGDNLVGESGSGIASMCP